MNRFDSRIYLFTIGHFAIDWAQGALPALLPYFIATCHMNYQDAGTLIFANLVFSSILQPVLGYYADQLDYVIFVSVEADREGLPFRPMTLGKVRRAREILPPNVQLWVDGGVNETNLPDVVMAGADAVVMGRAVFGAEDPVAAYERLVALGESYRRERDA